MAKITKLTPAQERALSEAVVEWRAIGLSCEPAERARAEATWAAMYREVGAEAPAVLWLSSPAMCLLACGALKTLAPDQLWDQLQNQLRGQLDNQLWGQLQDQLDNQLAGQLWNQLWDQLQNQLRDQLWNQLRDQLAGQLWNQLRDQLRDQLDNQLQNQLRGQLRGQLDNQLRGQLRGQLRNQLHREWWGQQEAYWIAFYRWPEATLGVTYGDTASRRLAYWVTLAETCNWWWAYDGLVVASERPESVSFDASRRLHSADGMACRYRDGWGVYAWHGVRVPARLIEDPASYSAAEVLHERNAEVRRAMIERIGVERIFHEAKARKINSSRWGTLYRLQLDDGPIEAVQVTCPSTARQYMLAVNPDIYPDEPRTALTAVASTWRKPVDGAPESEWPPVFASPKDYARFMAVET